MNAFTKQPGNKPGVIGKTFAGLATIVVIIGGFSIRANYAAAQEPDPTGSASPSASQSAQPAASPTTEPAKPKPSQSQETATAKASAAASPKQDEPGKLQPVWCHLTGSDWKAQLGAKPSGSREETFPLMGDFGDGTTESGQTLTHDRSSKFDAACAKQAPTPDPEPSESQTAPAPQPSTSSSAPQPSASTTPSTTKVPRPAMPAVMWKECVNGFQTPEWDLDADDDTEFYYWTIVPFDEDSNENDRANEERPAAYAQLRDDSVTEWADGSTENIWFYLPANRACDVPSPSPTTSPTSSPTVSPTTSPSQSPTSSPSPTDSPTATPTQSPTASPTASPTQSPTASPTTSPTTKPTEPAKPKDNNDKKQPTKSDRGAGAKTGGAEPAVVVVPMSTDLDWGLGAGISLTVLAGLAAVRAVRRRNG